VDREHYQVTFWLIPKNKEAAALLQDQSDQLKLQVLQADGMISAELPWSLTSGNSDQTPRSKSARQFLSKIARERFASDESCFQLLLATYAKMPAGTEDTLIKAVLGDGLFNFN
jgi:hypothetical protein